jgi:nitrogen fixation/metabolism regulation signal transduction histidine kinase
MGLGLHIANEVANLHKGTLEFPDRTDIGLSKDFDGAIVAIVFPENA